MKPSPLQATIIDGPPDANETSRHDPGDVLTEKWLGKITLNHEALAEPSPDEWVVIQAWDESKAGMDSLRYARAGWHTAR